MVTVVVVAVEIHGNSLVCVVKKRLWDMSCNTKKKLKMAPNLKQEVGDTILK